MRNRMTLMLAALTAIVLVGTIAWAAAPSQRVSVENQTVVSAGDAGEVVLAVGADLQIVDVLESAGWSAEVEVASGREVEVDFRSGDRRIQFNAELEDGEVRVRVRDRIGEPSPQTGSTGSTSTTDSTSTTTGSTTSTTSTSATAAATSAPSSTRMSGASGEMVASAGDAGEVVLAVGEDLQVVDVLSGAGWLAEVEVASGREVEVDFRSGDRRIQLNAELEDGEVRVRVRDRIGDTESETESSLGSGSTSTSTTTSTIDDSPSGDDETSTAQAPVSTSSGNETYTVPGVATIGITWGEGRLTLASYAVLPGWQVFFEEQSSERIRIEFENGDQEARFEARLDGHEVRVEIRGD